MLGMVRKGIPRVRPPLQTKVHILETDYNKLECLGSILEKQSMIFYIKNLKLQSMEENTKELEYQIDGLGNTLNTTLSQTI